MEKTLEKDSQIISLLRFPLTFLVVMQHCRGEIAMSSEWESFTLTDLYYALKIFFSGGLSLIAVPAFFFISGYLFFRHIDTFNVSIYKEKIRKRQRSLLVPFVLWNLVCIPLTCLVLYFEHYQLHPTQDIQEYLGNIRWLHIFWDHTTTLINFPNLLGMKSIYVSPLLGTMWYVRDLIVMIVFSPIVYLFTRKTGKYGVLLLTILFLLRIWPTITINQLSVYFFSLGAFYSIRRKGFQAPLAVKLLSCIATMGILFVFLILGGNENNIGWQLTPLFTLAGTFSIFFLTATLVNRRPNVQLPELLGNSSFFVYALHIEFALPIGFLIAKTITFHSANPVVLIVRYFLTPVIIYATCVSIYWMLKRICPKVLSLFTGNR
jgi:fucose 4-O-acetylase-like acetyltransferase